MITNEKFDTIYHVLPKKPELWTIDDVGIWLKSINMERYQKDFGNKYFKQS